MSGGAAPPASCIKHGSPPPHDGPYATVEDFCSDAPRGTPAPYLAPTMEMFSSWDAESYADQARQFVLDRAYIELGWASDAHWRLTGPVDGCASDGTLRSYGTHHQAIRIYYSPEVIDWLCSGRVGDLPAGAMMVKEAKNITYDNLLVDSETGELSTAQDLAPELFTVMIKSNGFSWDDWYWALVTPAEGNPPIGDRSGVSIPGFPEEPTAISPSWLPTGNRQGTAVYPFYGFGGNCVNCHSSAEKDQTYAALENLIGDEVVYGHLGPGVTPGRAPAPIAFPSALPDADPAFLAAFPQFDKVDFARAWDLRLPAETYDRAPAAAASEEPETFVTSDQCIACHDATIRHAGPPNMSVPRPDKPPLNLSPYAEWRASPMGLAGRDPVFYAQLESETNRMSYTPKLKGKEKCVENLCLYCHGVMGARQLTMDTASVPPDPDCEGLLPRDQEQGGMLFSRDMVGAWRDEDPLFAKYGGLARDGVSCATCHHIDEEGLGREETFTGNFHVTSPTNVVGPYSDPLTKPMENALGITPRGGEHMKQATACSSCHAVKLPVFKNDGTLVGHRYEQSTYLEWLNSGAKSVPCQKCHMSTKHAGGDLAFKIANIEDETIAFSHGRLPDADITLPVRAPYARHTLFGLNVFLTSFFEQFPLILGNRQIDTLNPVATPPLITAREMALNEMVPATASVAIDRIKRSRSGIEVNVTVVNKAGHNFPSGVGFRRAFIELVVLDAAGNTLWASGLTTKLGEIVDGRTGSVLPSEYFRRSRDGKGPDFQPHYEEITREDQVQIYEELVRDSDHRMTTSFLHRVSVEKDNRLRPRDWDSRGAWASVTEPHGTGRDTDYKTGPSKQLLDGRDSLAYKVPALAGAATVRATLYYQATPPYYLEHRFKSGKKGPSRDDTERLYYLASNLNVDARSESGEPYIKDWKLKIASTSAAVRAP
ncbi:hypothetical protein WME94_39105 [Sorangium sp. So ce429]